MRFRQRLSPFVFSVIGVIAVLASLIGVTLSDLRSYQQSLSEIAEYGLGWPISQGIAEISKFEHSILIYGFTHSPEDKESALLAFSVLENRIGILGDGVVRSFIDADADAQNTFLELKNAVGDIGKVVDRLETSRVRTFILKRLGPLIGPMSAMAGKAYQYNNALYAEKTTEILRLQHRFVLASLCLVASCLLLAGLLLLQNRRIRNSTAELARAKVSAETANATKNAFLANMSHEIRTPLSAILGFSKLLADVRLCEGERAHCIATIERNGQALTRIIDDILDLAKVEAGILNVENINFSLFELMTESVELFRPKATEKGIALRLRMDELAHTEMQSDPTRLRQVLINIIGNAVKFTDEGEVEVRVRSQRKSENSIQVTIEVTDTGPGMTKEQKDRLFKPFTQADNTTTRKYGGAGLGLALSKRLSEALGGNIDIADDGSAVGSTFVMTFVAKTAKNRNQKSLTSLFNQNSPAPINLLRDLRILVADDSPDNQYIVKDILVKSGAQVDLANNGREAVEIALAASHDLILMDIQMPEVDGYEALRMLKQANYRKPVVALTAHAMPEERVRTQAAGFAHHLTKPINSREILQMVASLTSMKFIDDQLNLKSLGEG